MRAFEYASPTTREQAVKLLGDDWDDAAVFAGGTDLLALMKDEVAHPGRLVNIKDIPEFKGITYSPTAGLRIGAAVTIQELVDHSIVRMHYRALTQAAEGITSPQIRAMGTVGGDLCQRPRCWYYRGGNGLLGQDESGKSLVEAGDNRYHAIFGNSGPAYFVSPSSLAPALIAFGAKLKIYGTSGSREVPVEKFFVTPQSATDREHDLKPNEIVGEIVVPHPAVGTKSATYEVRQKEALDWPLATASVVLNLSGGHVKHARVVMGHVAPVPWPSAEAEEILTGKAVNEGAASEAGAAAIKGAKAL
ncbi:MAG TPA: FAD binding domain-containing protein, partial [Blastocatellia bacterium]|nr:FAD binding domain-containing protein [Blastocatellia bacterium]